MKNEESLQRTDSDPGTVETLPDKHFNLIQSQNQTKHFHTNGNLTLTHLILLFVQLYKTLIYRLSEVSPVEAFFTSAFTFFGVLHSPAPRPQVTRFRSEFVPVLTLSNLQPSCESQLQTLRLSLTDTQKNASFEGTKEFGHNGGGGGVVVRMCEPTKPARGAPVEATYNQVIAAENAVAGPYRAAGVRRFRLYYRSITEHRSTGDK